MAEIIITSSVLILVLTAVRYLLKGELSVRVQYALWLLVAVRLLVPVTFASASFSVLNAAPTVELPDRGSVYLSDQGVTAQEPSPQIGYANSSVGSDGEYIPGDAYEFYYPPDSNGVIFVPVGEAPPEGYTTVPASHILPTPKGVLTAVWYIGMAAMGGWFLWVNLSFRRKLRAGARRVEIPDCPVPVFAVEDIPSPCLFGLLRPAVYVTPACLEDKDRLRHVLAHELTHRRHGDQFWSLVRCACLTVYWFHPLVWLAAALSRRDCELACDEGALSRLGEEERTAYGRTLIGLMAVSASPTRLLQTATTMVDGKGGVKERVLFIAKKPRVVALTGVVAVLVAAVAAACTFTGAEAPEASQPNAAPSGPEPSPAVSDFVPGRYATVEEALADMPAELSPTGEESFLSGITGLTLENDMGPYGPKLEEGELFRAYSRVHLALSSNLENPLGWMASVYRMDQAAYDALVEVQGQTGREQDTYWECFAKDGEAYYLIYAPLKAPELRSDLTEGAQLREKLVAWLKQAVLSAQGVEAFAGERFEYAYTPTRDPGGTELIVIPVPEDGSGTNSGPVSYIATGSMYEIYGYDVYAMTWMPPQGRSPKVGQLYYANPSFLGSFFRENAVEGSAELEDGVIRVGFTVGRGTGGTTDGPNVGFKVDTSDAILERTFFNWEGYSITMSDEAMIQIARALREVIQGVEAYHEAYSNGTVPPSLTNEELDWFNTEFFNHHEDERRMNNMLLNSSYAAPEDIDLYQLFYDGTSRETATLTSGEQEQLAEVPGFELNLDVDRVTTREMDDFLRKKLGIGLEETAKKGLENFVYLPDFDAYYLSHGDTHFQDYHVIGGYRDESGLVTLYYRMVAVKGVVTLRENGEDYIFLSNIHQ